MKYLMKYLIASIFILVSLNVNAFYATVGYKHSIFSNSNYIDKTKTKESKWELLDSNYKKSEHQSGLYFGIGYNYTDNISFGAEYSHAFLSNKKFSENFSVTKNCSIHIDNQLKHSSNLILFRLNYDLYKKDRFGIFATSGLGVNFIEYKNIENIKNVSYASNAKKKIEDSQSVEFKKRASKIAYNLGFGISYDIDDDITLESKVDYTSFGKIKINDVKTKLNSQGITLGVKRHF